MFGIGFGELIVIAIVGFIAVGPKHLPSVMRKIAVFYRQLLGFQDEFKFQMMNLDDQHPASKTPEVLVSKALEKSERE